MTKSVEQLLAEQWLPSEAMRRALRQSAGLTLEQVAQRLGVTKMTVHRWETGKRTPRGNDRINYSKFLRALKDALDHV